MTTLKGRTALRALIPAAGLLALTACTANTDEDAATVSVTSSDDSCVMSATRSPAGSVVFDVTNDGSKVAEFYVYAEDGTTILSEVENVGPGTTRSLVVSLEPGMYVTACDPGMDGDDIRADFEATADAGAAPASASPELEAAAETYLAYVRDQIDALVDGTDDFAAALRDGDLDNARDLYPAVRTYWESIEPVAESFGDLDPRLDLREADLGPDEEWTGWHRLEKYLWPPSEGYDVEPATLNELIDQLVADTAELQQRVDASDFAIEPFQIGNGAKELLDEVSGSKITGEEEIWSGTDLWDIKANVDGAYEAYQALRPVVEGKDDELVAELDSRFADVQALLATYGSYEQGFPAYNTLTDEQVVELSRTIEALSEPLSHLTATAVL